MSQPYNFHQIEVSASAPPMAYAEVVDCSSTNSRRGTNKGAISEISHYVNEDVDRLQSNGVIHEGQARAFLSQRHWPNGLQDCFIRNAYKIAYRVFICDDSGSMAASDGNRIIDINGDTYGNRK